MSPSNSQYHLSPDQQNLLVAALASNRPSSSNNASATDRASKPSDKEKGDKHSAKQNEHQNYTDGYSNQSAQNQLTPGQFPEPDDSPYLGFDLDADLDDKFDFDNNGQFIDDFTGDVSQIDAGDLHEKRKSIEDNDDEEEGGGKRRESEGGSGKKPGRKPLTAEPTSVSCP